VNIDPGSLTSSGAELGAKVSRIPAVLRQNWWNDPPGCLVKCDWRSRTGNARITRWHWPYVWPNARL